jgi:fatty-acid desaturase
MGGAVNALPKSLASHRVSVEAMEAVVVGEVKFAPLKSLWFLTMATAAIVGGIATFSWRAFALFAISTGVVLLFGHSLGSHRKLVHNSFQCPRWLEYLLVYCGVHVGLAGPIGLLRQHELRDYAQRLPQCHSYLRHGQAFWQDAWWQLNCNLHLSQPPKIEIESSIERDGFYRFLERTWVAHHVIVGLLLYVLGGWAFVFWGLCARVTAGVVGHWCIGYAAHNHGQMHHEVVGAAVQGRNVPLASLLTMGECWHNNHHAFPGSAKLGLYKGEWDPGWWVLLVLKRMGLVWNLRLPEHLPAREELRALHSAADRTDDVIGINPAGVARE